MSLVHLVMALAVRDRVRRTIEPLRRAGGMHSNTQSLVLHCVLHCAESSGGTI